MGITTIFDYYKTPVSKVPLLTALLYIKNGKFKKFVDALRRYYMRDLDADFTLQKRLMPRISVSGNFVLKDEKLKLVSYSHCIALEILYLNEKDLLSVKKQLSKDPFVTACFRNVLGIGLVIIVKTETGLTQHREVFKRLVKYFEDLTGVRRFATLGDALDHTILISADAEMYLNWEAAAFQSVPRPMLASSY